MKIRLSTRRFDRTRHFLTLQENLQAIEIVGAISEKNVFCVGVHADGLFAKALLKAADKLRP